MKYDCRSINDIVTLYYPNDTFLIVAACSDCYIRVFNLKDLTIFATIRGVFGSPLCLDVSGDNNLLIAGYEDDSFIIYGIKTNFLPLCRGLGHSSFVSQVKFDNFLQDFLSKASRGDFDKPVTPSVPSTGFDKNLLSGLKESSPRGDELSLSQ